MEELTKRGVPARLVARLEVVDVQAVSSTPRCSCEALAHEQRKVIAKKVRLHAQRGPAAVIEHEEAAVRVVENDGQAYRCERPVANERVWRWPDFTADGAALEVSLMVHGGS